MTIVHGKLMEFSRLSGGKDYMARIGVDSERTGGYECPRCGNEDVELEQGYCRICGEALEGRIGEHVLISISYLPSIKSVMPEGVGCGMSNPAGIGRLTG